MITISTTTNLYVKSKKPLSETNTEGDVIATDRGKGRIINIRDHDGTEGNYNNYADICWTSVVNPDICMKCPALECKGRQRERV